MHVVLQFSKYHYHTKFQINFFNGYWVLEEIPPNCKDSGSKTWPKSCFILFLLAQCIWWASVGPHLSFARNMFFFVLFRKFWPAQSSPAIEIFHTGLIGSEDGYKNVELESGDSFLPKTTWIFKYVPIEPPKNPSCSSPQSEPNEASWL